ncbi:hypothetical protein NM208_g12585 [Fusarium decemcellulare]|uniref:Uncharacterized protein n=1 Tax=Fusarium decemcellulare TaxID=57161 RepID=A0ACC1RNG0_9HYPO|nr:hypothetical protein NM208_g12585 [Fusarium decemcellulare]
MKVLVATFCAVDKQQHNLALEVWSSTGVRHWRLCASVLLTKNPLENGIERDIVSPSRTKREEQAHESDAIASDRLVNAMVTLASSVWDVNRPAYAYGLVISLVDVHLKPATEHWQQETVEVAGSTLPDLWEARTVTRHVSSLISAAGNRQSLSFGYLGLSRSATFHREANLMCSRDDGHGAYYLLDSAQRGTAHRLSGRPVGFVSASRPGNGLVGSVRNASQVELTGECNLTHPYTGAPNAKASKLTRESMYARNKLPPSSFLSNVPPVPVIFSDGHDPGPTNKVKHDFDRRRWQAHVEPGNATVHRSVPAAPAHLCGAPCHVGLPSRDPIQNVFLKSQS